MPDHVIVDLWNDAHKVLPRTIVPSLSDLKSTLPHDTEERPVVDRVLRLVEIAERQNTPTGFVQKLFGGLFDRQDGGINNRHPLGQFLDLFAPQMHLGGKELKSTAISMVFDTIHQVQQVWQATIHRAKQNLPEEEVVRLPQEQIVTEVALFVSAAKLTAQRHADFITSPDVRDKNKLNDITTPRASIQLAA